MSPTEDKVAVLAARRIVMTGNQLYLHFSWRSIPFPNLLNASWGHRVAGAKPGCCWVKARIAPNALPVRHTHQRYRLESTNEPVKQVFGLCEGNWRKPTHAWEHLNHTPKRPSWDLNRGPHFKIKGSPGKTKSKVQRTSTRFPFPAVYSASSFIPASACVWGWSCRTQTGAPSSERRNSLCSVASGRTWFSSLLSAGCKDDADTAPAERWQPEPGGRRSWMLAAAEGGESGVCWSIWEQLARSPWKHSFGEPGQKPGVSARGGSWSVTTTTRLFSNETLDTGHPTCRRRVSTWNQTEGYVQQVDLWAGDSAIKWSDIKQWISESNKPLRNLRQL